MATNPREYSYLIIVIQILETIIALITIGLAAHRLYVSSTNPWYIIFGILAGSLSLLYLVAVFTKMPILVPPIIAESALFLLWFVTLVGTIAGGKDILNEACIQYYDGTNGPVFFESTEGCAVLKAAMVVEGLGCILLIVAAYVTWMSQRNPPTLRGALTVITVYSMAYAVELPQELPLESETVAMEKKTPEPHKSASEA
ncbi:hypothetical protein RUND412_011228 [Rhizina undulata]